MELAMFGAWQTARLTNYSDGKLKPLKDYLSELKPKRQQTAEEMVRTMRAVKAMMADSSVATPQPG